VDGSRMRGRKPKQQSREAEFREKLIAWKQIPAAFRPSLRALARELGTSHQLLSHYLSTLDEWQREKELESFRAKAKAKNIPVTLALERGHLAWLRRVEVQQARKAARAAKRAGKILAAFRKMNKFGINLPVLFRGIPSTET